MAEFVFGILPYFYVAWCGSSLCILKIWARYHLKKEFSVMEQLPGLLVCQKIRIFSNVMGVLL